MNTKKPKLNGCGRVEDDGVYDARMCDGCTWSVSREACEDFRDEYNMTRIRFSVTRIDGGYHGM